jgi:hypothetical protein
MATLVLGAVGTAIGGAFGGAILGFSGAAIGGFIGSTVGSVVDSWIVSSLAPAQRIEGARLDTLRITSATEGAVIPRLGRMRIGGNIIWATDFREETKTTTQGGGKGGGGGKVKTTEYLYYASFAVALCEGPITGIGRVWADGKAMDMTGVTWRWYPGNEAQTADPFIAAKMGAPARLPAARLCRVRGSGAGHLGNRLPQLVRSLPPVGRSRHRRRAEGRHGIPPRASSPMPPMPSAKAAVVRRSREPERAARSARHRVALDRLQAMAPAVGVSLSSPVRQRPARGICKVCRV